MPSTVHFVHHEVVGRNLPFAEISKKLLPYLPLIAPGKNQSRPNESVHEISNNVACATSKASDQPAHTRSLIRAFASRLSIL